MAADRRRIATSQPPRQARPRRDLGLQLALNHDFLTREDRAATLVNSGVLLMRRGHDSRALTDFDGAAALNPELGEAQLMRGIALVQLDRYPEAVDTLTQAIAMNPERPERAYFYRAAAYEELGNAQSAYADYQRAAELAPELGFAAN